MDCWVSNLRLLGEPQLYRAQRIFIYRFRQSWIAMRDPSLTKDLVASVFALLAGHIWSLGRTTVPM